MRAEIRSSKNIDTNDLSLVSMASAPHWCVLEDEKAETLPPLHVNLEGESLPARFRGGERQHSSADEDHQNTAIDSMSRTELNSLSVPTRAAGNGSSINGNDNLHIIAPRKGPQSFFSGSKIKHLKKIDGIPLWRRDIQYEFLKAVFENTIPAFTNSYTQEKGQTFSDVYVDAMARSSKTSKILRDKLMSEKSNALNMAMVCLLVNVGRMNTTLNCEHQPVCLSQMLKHPVFPEMKAQLRTYHAIPSLQAYSDSQGNAYKQLQDAPRLKSILKGACEDRKEPQTLEQIVAQSVPRTNPINLIFIMSTYAPKVTEQHFPDNMEFYDLVMRPTLSSKSRATNFLWLMWFYLESDITANACYENPFGQGKVEGKKLLVPDFEYLTEEQANEENRDTAYEEEFGKKMQEERKSLCYSWC